MPCSLVPPLLPLPLNLSLVAPQFCGTCQRECIPIRSESRCLCGHRHKEHQQDHAAGAWRCGSKGCTCPGFFYIVAEGAWVLRCRCKHKHIEHSPATRACAKPGCSCAAFDSPWVCNCDHPWAQHTQVEVYRGSGGDMAAMMRSAAADVNRWDLLRRGADEPQDGGSNGGGSGRSGGSSSGVGVA
ncbi:hypothetical protein ABPG77_007682 [Micractinium sp. CCAP 211/92]